MLCSPESSNRVKTDKRDSRQLALLLAKGRLKRVYVPTPQEREQRAVARRRRQLIRERVRTQNRIKAELRFYGTRLPEITGRWSKLYVANLSRIRFSTRWQQESFESLLAQYEFFTKQIEGQTRLLRSLSQTAEYCERVRILQSVPGVGLIVAMELLRRDLGAEGRQFVLMSSRWLGERGVRGIHLAYTACFIDATQPGTITRAWQNTADEIVSAHGACVVTHAPWAEVWTLLRGATLLQDTGCGTGMGSGEISSGISIGGGSPITSGSVWGYGVCPVMRNINTRLAVASPLSCALSQSALGS